MATMKLPDLVFGPAYYFQDRDRLKEALTIARAGGIRHIDTAQVYGDMEDLLGATGVDDFLVSTKDPGGSAGPINVEELAHSPQRSMQKLKVQQLDIFYLHAPDDKTPYDKYVPIIDEMHKNGLFTRFGVSNFSAHQLEGIHNYCKTNNYVLPSVCQVQYNAFSRGQETLLVPTLRRLSVSLAAYSPLAGGFLGKTREQFEAGDGRFRTDTVINQMYYFSYNKPKLVDALKDWGDVANEEGCSRASLAYRWIRYHSALKGEYGDSLVFSSRDIPQLEETFRDIEKGPLKDRTVQAIDEIWEKIKDEAPVGILEAFSQVDMSLVK